MSVLFLLDDGETLTLEEDDLRPIYDLLWQLAPKPGAVSTAALIHDSLRLSEFARAPIALSVVQTAVIKEAVERLQTES